MSKTYNLNDLYETLEWEWIQTLLEHVEEKQRVSVHPTFKGNLEYLEAKLDTLDDVLNKIDRMIGLNDGSFYPGPPEVTLDD